MLLKTLKGLAVVVFLLLSACDGEQTTPKQLPGSDTAENQKKDNSFNSVGEGDDSIQPVETVPETIDSNRGNRSSDSTEQSPAPKDSDGDNVDDQVDNCPDIYNANQCDSDQDGIGDDCTVQSGTSSEPFIVPACEASVVFYDTQNTCDASQSLIDSYPPHSQNESGPEYVYVLHLHQRSRVEAALLTPEPAGTDVDIHLLSSLQPLAVISRDNSALSEVLEPGQYYLVLDTFVTGSEAHCGSYDLTVKVAAIASGTIEDPVIIGGNTGEPLALPYWYEDARDTRIAMSQSIDHYPPFPQDESGPEYIYSFTVDREVRVSAVLQFPEPDGVDVDIHLLSSISPPVVIERGNRSAYAILEPGTYFVVVDTWVNTEGIAQAGNYKFSLSVRERGATDPEFFSPYILAAVDYLYADYGLLGYDAAALTHDMTYGDFGFIKASGGAKTMCVAAVMEVMLQAMTFYAEDTGDTTVFDFLPISSWKSLHSKNIRAHIWVNHKLNSYGTADALVNFGMGETIPFESLKPGAFINLNRTTGTGHAVVFIAFIDAKGIEYSKHHKGVVGFKYFSAQGGFAVDAGGLDYRYAIFSEHGKLEMPYKRDTKVIYSKSQKYLNTGAMLMPQYWVNTATPETLNYIPPTEFDPSYFSGWTVDDWAGH